MQNNSKYAEKNKFAENLKSANVTYFLHFSAYEINYAEKLFSAFLHFCFLQYVHVGNLE
jgi:hypothetical protein